MRNPFVRRSTDEHVPQQVERERSWNPYVGLDPALAVSQTLVGAGPVERPAYYADIASVFRGNTVVYALVDVRVKALAEVRFQFRQRVKGRPGPYFGTAALEPLELPWPGGTTRDLVAQMVVDHDLAGNAYVVRRGPDCVRLRPDWVEIIFSSSTGDPNGVDSVVQGYRYMPGGEGSGQQSTIYLAEQVAHWRGLPDPAARFRGLSWVTPALGSVAVDTAVTEFTARYFDNGAAPSLVLTMPPDMTEQEAKVWHRRFMAGHAGSANKHRPLFLANGATATTVGANGDDAGMKDLQGASETRISATAGVPPVIAGFSEGLSSTSYAAYAAARRRFADYTLTPLLGELTDAVTRLITMAPGAGVYLSYDPRDISHFQDDAKDSAIIQQTHAATIASLFQAGFTPESAVDAVMSGELTRLVHTGAASVQVGPPTAISSDVVTSSEDTTNA